MQAGRPDMRRNDIVVSGAAGRSSQHEDALGQGMAGQPAGTFTAEQEAYRRQAAGLLRQLRHLAPQARSVLHALQQPVRSRLTFPHSWGLPPKLSNHKQTAGLSKDM